MHELFQLLLESLAIFPSPAIGLIHQEPILPPVEEDPPVMQATAAGERGPAKLVASSETLRKQLPLYFGFLQPSDSVHRISEQLMCA